MKRYRIPVVVILLISLVMHLSSCRNHTAYEYFLIRVDSVNVPEAVFANEPFDLRFFGFVGSDGCHSFDRFIADKQDSLLFIELWGKLNINSYACPDVIVELNGKKLNNLLDEPGNYTLKIKQPDGIFLEREILVQ